MSHLMEAIERTALPNLFLVSIGYQEHHLRNATSGRVDFGYITDPHHLAMIYSAADIFVGPSLEEAFGQVFVEAAACGTPSIAYPVGGVTEALANGVSGRLAVQVDPSALAEAITELYWNPQLRHELGAWGRIYVENEFSPATSYTGSPLSCARPWPGTASISSRRSAWAAPSNPARRVTS
ncbi:MAG: glycosyltransferase [Verrucomicrobiota bacterium]